MAERYVVDEPAAHWYTPHGEPFHTMPTADGKSTRKVDIRDAHRLGLLPSVTNILGVLYKPGLEAWKQNQLVLAALDFDASLYPDGTREEMAAWIIARAAEPSERGKDVGTRVHQSIDLWLKRDLIDEDGDIAEVTAGFREWYRQQGMSCVHSERASASDYFGYGGTYDLYGGISLLVPDPIPVDWKTQAFTCDCEVRGCKERHPVHYPEWGAQLAAYSSLIGYGYHAGSASVAISSVVPGLVDLKLYTPDETRDNWLSFLAALRLWYSKLGRGARLPRPAFMVREEEELR